VTPSNVEITDNISRSIGNFFLDNTYSNIAVLVDENTEQHCYPVVQHALPQNHILIRIKSGERHKNIHTCQQIWKSLTDKAFDRKSILVNLGGGVIGDMGGFCAATYKRGIDFINIPTTLLAQVDASAGGKLGIDFEGLKNHIGVFKLPKRVVISTAFLKTLSIRELRSGYAEIVKHCLIADEKAFHRIARESIDEQDWDEIVAHSVAIKNKVVLEDPQELGLRKILNFGHTVGHAVETYKINAGEDILHGEAIAIGMICEAWLSMQINKMPSADFEAITTYLCKVYKPSSIDSEHIDGIARLTYQDKKNMGNVIRAALLDRIGHCLFDNNIALEDIKNSIEKFNEVAN